MSAGPNPFVGPRPFERGERLYGREREVSELHFRLNAERIILLHSPSGAGKSSLLQAGLLPLLARSFDVWGPARVNAEPTVSGINRYVLSAMQGFEEGVPKELRRPPEVLAAQTLAESFEKRPRRRSAPANVVLLFDQFEEILTVDPLAVEAKHELFEQLGELLRNPRIWALFALREDYLAPLDPYARQVPTHLKNRFRIDLLDRAAARKAMVEPAREAGREFPAVDKLISDLAAMKVQQPDGSFVEETGQHVEPVQLQVVCRRLWDAMPADDLTIDEKDLESFGDVTAALAAYYADSVARIAADDLGRERAIRDWFGEELITAGGIRGQVLRETAASGGLANELIEPLRGTHLVRAEKRAGATWYELAHDRLIEPVTSDNAAWRERHLVEAQRRAALWEGQGRPAGLLLTGPEVAEGERWAAENTTLVTEIERRFLEESREQQDQTDQKRRQARRIRWLAIGATLTTLVAVVALGFAMDSYRKVKQAYIEAEQEARLSASRELALQSSQLLDKQLDLALLLALEAGRIAPTIEARRSLLTALQYNHRLWRFLPPSVDERLRVAFRPGGSMLAAAGESNVIELWDLGTGRQLPGSPLRLAEAFEVRAVAFSPDGRWLAAGGKTATNAGLLGLWDVSVSPPRRYVTPQLETVVRSLAFCGRGGGTRLAWNTKDELSLWPLRGTEERRVLRKGPRVASIAMTQDCARLAVGHEWTGAIELWNLTGPSIATAPRSLAENVPGLKTLAFDPAGHRLAAAGKGRSIALWDLKTSRHKPLDAGTPVRSLAFRPDGKVLAAAGDIGIILLDLETEELLENLLAEVDESDIDLSHLSKQELAAFLPEAAHFLLEQEVQKPKPLAGHDGPVSGIAFNQAGDVLASAGEDGKLILWKPGTDQRLGRQLGGPGHPVWAVSFSPDSHRLVSAAGWRPGEVRPGVEEEPAEPAVVEGSVRLWNLGTGEGAVLPGNPGPSRAAAFSPDGRSIAAGSREIEGGTLHLWQLDGKDGKAVEAARWQASKPVNAVVFSPDGKSLFAAEGEDLVRWSLDPKPPRSQPLATHQGNIWSLLFRRAGGSLLAGDETGNVTEWDGAAGGSQAVLAPAAGILAALAESPDGHFLAAASWKGGSRCVYLWEMPSGSQDCLAGHQEPVSAVAFARDGSLISADDGGQLIFWDPRTWQIIGRVRHRSPINGLAASPDGRSLAAASSDGKILLLDLDWNAAAHSIAGRELTQEECAAWIHFEPKPASCARER